MIDTWESDRKWHVARERQQDIMRRNTPDYPSEETFRPVGGWCEELRPNEEK